MKLIYDATMIAAGFNNSSRTGIYFTVLNIFKELLARKDIELTLYCNIKNYRYLLSELKKLYPEKAFDIMTDISCEKFARTHSELYAYKNEIRKNNNYFKKFIVQLQLLFFSILLRLSSLISSLYVGDLDNYDAYLSPMHKPPKRVAKNSKLKKAVILYDAVPILFPKLNPCSKKGSWYNNLLNSLNSKDYYFAISESTRQDFLKYFAQIDPKKINTILLACNESFVESDSNLISEVRAKYNIPRDKKYVFSLCTLEPRKNLIRTVKTFIEFIKKNNIENMVFVLGGGHWEMFIDKLNQEIENLGEYKDKILKIGYVDDEDLSALYSGAEWFTYTSQYEGFGLPPLEAMSCGCPVITSNNSSLPEVVGDAGIMIDWNSDQQHIEAYEKYYFNEELRKEYAQKGLERAIQFSWKKCVDEMVDAMRRA